MKILKSKPNEWGWYIRAYTRKTCKDIVIEKKSIKYPENNHEISLIGDEIKVVESLIKTLKQELKE